MEKTKMTKILLPRGRKNEENFVIVSVNGRKMADEARCYVERMAD